MSPTNSRRSFIKLAGVAGIAAVAPTTGSAKQPEYPEVDNLHSYDEEPVEDFAADYAVHPSQDRVAVVTAAFGGVINLYIADGAADETEVPETIYQITKDTDGGVFRPVWKEGNRLKFDKDLKRYKTKIPPSYKVLTHKIEVENLVEEGA